MQDQPSIASLTTESLDFQLNLEKTKARILDQALAMRESSDLHEIIQLIYRELHHFGIKAHSVNLLELHSEQNGWSIWAASSGGVFPEKINIPYKDISVMKTLGKCLDQREKDFGAHHFHKRQKDAFLNHVHSHSPLPSKRYIQIKKFKEMSTGLSIAESSALLVIFYQKRSFTQKEELVIEHISKSFDYAYTRFLDLQKAEAQARNAHIEAGLERVRASAMAMHNTKDLSDTVNVFFKELKTLGVQPIRCGVAEIKEESRSWSLAVTNASIQGDTYKLIGEVKNLGHPILKKMYRHWEIQKGFFPVLMHKEMKEYYKILRPQLAVPKFSKYAIHYGNYFYFEEGFVFAWTDRSLTEEELNIFRRFTSVLSLTYKRYRDLKEAETQAKEAKIEAALERVRSASMAMHHTSELQQVINTVGEQMRSLEMDITGGVFISINLDIDRDLYVWGSGETAAYAQRTRVPFYNHPIFKKLVRHLKNGSGLLLETYSKKEKIGFLKHLFKYPPYNQTSKSHQKSVLSREGGYSRACYTSAFTSIFMINHHGRKFSEVDNYILQRFATVFEQSYRRFLDLQKAEAQAREAQIEAALERVRARSIGMQKSEELQDVIKVIFDQLTELDINAEHAGIVVDYEPKKDWHFWIAETMDIPAKVTVPYLDLIWDRQFTTAKKKGQDFFTTLMDFETKNEFYKILLPHIPEIDKKTLDFYFSCPGLAISTVVEKDIGLYVENFSATPYTETENEVIKRFGKVFQQTYTRFLDLEKAEGQAREAQIEVALERVRAASMAMHKSEELNQIISTVFEELKELGFKTLQCEIILFDPDTLDCVIWPSNEEENVLPRSYRIPYNKRALYQFIVKAWKTSTDYCPYILKGRVKSTYEKWLFSQTDWKEIPDSVKQSMQETKRVYLYGATIKHGILEIGGKEPISDEKFEIVRRFGNIFEQSYTRFLDLKKAESQAREAQIEVALERIRAASLAMHKTEDLKEVVKVLFEEMQGLSVEMGFGSVSIYIFSEGTRNIDQWIALNGSVELLHVPYFEHPILSEIFKAKKRGDDFFAEVFPVEIKNSWTEKGFEITDYKYLPEDFKEAIRAAPGYSLSLTLSKNSGIAIPNFQGKLLSDEDNEILKRVGKVFEQSYIRFLDLQKAEEQAREANINLALERVRARTMAMHKSEELADISYELFKQVQSLGVTTWHCAFNIYDEGQNSSTEWGTNEGGTYPVYKTPREGIFLRYYEIGQKGETLHIEVIGEDKSADHYAWLCTLPGVGDQLLKLRDAGIPFPTSQIDHVAYFKYGYLIFITYDPVPDAHDIFRRFAKIFEQSYTRFLDLQKAEKQTREAQIEAALERVRAASMAMHKTNELAKVVDMLFQQFSQLNLDFYQVWINIFVIEEGYSNCWFSPVEGIIPQAYTAIVPLGPFEESSIKSWRAGEEFSYLSWRGLKEVDEIMKSLTEMTGHPSFQKIQQKKRMDRLEIVDSNHKYGVMAMAKNTDITDEDRSILKRFTKVFEQSYTRFLDLKKAEEQTREARIEAAMERVRGKAMAMQQPEELKDVAQVLRTEMGKLDIEELETCSIYIKEKDTTMAECWYAIKDIREEEKVLASDQFQLDLNATWVGKEMLQFYNSDSERVSIVMKGDARKEWINYCETQSDPLQGYYGENIPERTYHLYKFTHGAIGFASAGDISEESWNILARASSVFSLAYARFQDLTRARQDLKRLKEEKARAEDALTRLKATQSQLIHAEKMASLGELTAGIAHEIKNPLNFVNNFSEVSGELLEEMVEEIKQGETEEAFEIVKDLKNNLHKIVEHGKRADSIVKGMLQHSRSSSGEKEPTDINALADEYLRLAYHGYRAKDKSFNANFKTDFDDKLDRIMVVPQEIGRVLLNIISNAFQAVRDRSLQSNIRDNYEPTVIVKTRKQRNNVRIEIIDNGPGMSNAIKNKIFQPFFTTKPTGEGTGLGLSMSFDIIKLHHGKISVDTKEGKGTTFIIILPIINP